MRTWIFVFMAGLLVVGCRPADPLAQVVFVKADDLTITAKDAKESAELLAALQALAGKPVNEMSRVKWINRTAMRVVPSLVASALLDREFRRRGIQASDSVREDVLSRYRKQVRQPAATLDDIADGLGAQGARFRRQFARECRLEQYLRDCGTVVPSDEDIEIAEAQLKQVIERNEAENARAKARGEEAWRRLAAGEAWDAVAAAYSEDKLLYGDDCDYAKEWETVDPKHFYLQEIADALPGMEVGAFTKPIETDEGLLIVRVAAKEDDARYVCVRILIRLKVKMEMPERADLKRNLEKENRAQAQLDLLADLRKGVTFEYPLGTNFTYKVLKEPTKAGKSAKSPVGSTETSHTKKRSHGEKRL